MLLTGIRSYSRLNENLLAFPATLCQQSLTQSNTLSSWSTGRFFDSKLHTSARSKALPLNRLETLLNPGQFAQNHQQCLLHDMGE